MRLKQNTKLSIHSRNLCYKKKSCTWQLCIAMIVLALIPSYAQDSKADSEFTYPPKEILSKFSALSKDTKVEMETHYNRPLLLYGRVVDVYGTPLVNTQIEIWQTDAQGIYLHSGDFNTKKRDKNFQFFGSANTDNNGWYFFRTLMPGQYEPRPRHIHFKIKQNNSTLLTSQFYFSQDTSTISNTIPEFIGEHKPLNFQVYFDKELQTYLVFANVVVQAASKKDSPILYKRTRSNPEGPFYPETAVIKYDNDLLINN